MVLYKLVPVLLFVVLLVLLPFCSSHGIMCEPRQRGAYEDTNRCGYTKNIGENKVIVDYCPHCLNGGSKGTVAQNLPVSGWAEYDPINDITTAQRAGLCGDAKGKDAHMLGGSFVPERYGEVPIMNVSQTGGTIDFMVEIDTNHNGYYEFFLCDLDACQTSDIQESCFSNGHCHKLLRVPHNTCEDPSTNTEYECGPIDENYPGRWYVPCRATTNSVGVHLVGGPSGTMRYKLPNGLMCKHCVVQWYWATANSCNPRGMVQYFEKYNNPFGTACFSDGGGLGAHNPRLEACGGDSVPEEFWTCGDIQISADGTSPGDVYIGKVSTSSSSPGVSPIATTTPSVSSTSSNSPRFGAPDGTMTPSPSTSLTPSPSTMPSEIVDTSCLDENSSCDGTVPCCDAAHVCVHTVRGGGFTCIPWTTLWQEDADQRSIRG